MNLKMCKIKDSSKTLRGKITTIEEYDKKDLYLNFLPFEYKEYYSLGMTKVTDENLRNFLLDCFRISLSSALHTFIFSLYRVPFPAVCPPAFSSTDFYSYVSQLKMHYLSKMEKVVLCNIEDGDDVLASLEIYFYLNTSFARYESRGKYYSPYREDIFLLYKSFSIGKKIIWQLIEKVRKAYAASTSSGTIYEFMGAKFDILDYLGSFIEEKAKNSSVHFERNLKLEFRLGKCELLDGSPNSIKINILNKNGLLAENEKKFYFNEWQVKKVPPEKPVFKEEEFALYCLKRIMEENKEIPEIRNHYDKHYLAKRLEDKIGVSLHFILILLQFELLSLYVSKKGLEHFINKDIFGGIRYTSIKYKSGKFSTILLKIQESFNINEIDKNENLAAKMLIRLLEAANFGLKRINIQGKKMRVVIKRELFTVYYESYRIFQLHFIYKNSEKTIRIIEVRTLFYPEDVMILLEDKEFKEDIRNLLKQFNINSDEIDFMLTIMKSQIL